jgi:predicted ATPase/DNA-binding CsgD family transcriptional regulator
LRVRGERVFPVEPLHIPDAVPERDLGVLADVPAIALLVERARDVNAHFSMTRENAAALVAICRRLDGLPLGIELAAPRLRVLSPDALLALLDDRMRVEENTPRDLPERHRSLQAAIAWSYELLAPREQSVFRGLSLFPGSFELAAAAATLQLDETTALTAMEALVEQSLVQCRPLADGEMRFSLLDSLRAYAAEQLRDHGEEDWARANHAGYVLDWLEQHHWEPDQPRPSGWLDRVDLDYPNMRAALDYLMQRGTWERELRLAMLLGEYWMFRGSVSEGIGHLTAAIERGSQSGGEALGLASSQCAFLHFLAGDMEEALRFGEASIPLMRRTSSANELGVALQTLAIILGSGLQRWAEATELLHEAENYQPVSNPYATSILGELFVQMGEVERGVAAIESTLPIFREQGNWLDAGFHLLTLGMVEAERGNTQAAAERFAESLRLMRQSGATNQALYPLTQITLLAANAGLPRTTARMLGMADRFRRRLGIELLPHSVEPIRRAEAHARELGGETQFQEQFEAGRALPLPLALEAAIQIADLLAARGNVTLLEHQWTAQSEALPGAHRSGLTPREREVLALMIARQTDAEIADQLFIGYRTVTTHVARIIAKLGARNRRDAAALALQYRLLDEPSNT